MEFLFVEFDEDRNVIIDSVPGDWVTKQTLYIEAGPHRVGTCAYLLRSFEQQVQDRPSSPRVPTLRASSSPPSAAR
jgi:hypothetical protein